jgi:hypothetical protein
MRHRDQIPARVKQRAAPPQERADEATQRHQHTDPDHDAEGKERPDQRRPVGFREILEPRKEPVIGVSEDQRARVWNGDLV